MRKRDWHQARNRLGLRWSDELQTCTYTGTKSNILWSLCEGSSQSFQIVKSQERLSERTRLNYLDRRLPNWCGGTAAVSIYPHEATKATTEAGLHTVGCWRSLRILKQHVNSRRVVSAQREFVQFDKIRTFWSSKLWVLPSRGRRGCLVPPICRSGHSTLHW